MIPETKNPLNATLDKVYKLSKEYFKVLLEKLDEEDYKRKYALLLTSCDPSIIDHLSNSESMNEVMSLLALCETDPRETIEKLHFSFCMKKNPPSKTN